MPASALTAVTPFQVVLFCKYLVAFRAQVIITFFERDYFSDHGKQVFRVCFCKYRRKPYLYAIIRIMILVFKYIFPAKYAGLALWPFIVVKHSDLKHDHDLVNHERIHLRQQLEMLILPFYVWYTIEWLVLFLAYGNAYRAYKLVSFEQEAYQQEANPGYLNTRKPWSFLNYLGRKTT